MPEIHALQKFGGNERSGLYGMKLEDLTSECLVTAFIFLTARDVSEAGLSSRKFHNLASSDFIWHSLYFAKWPSRLTRAGTRSYVRVGKDNWLRRFRDRVEGSSSKRPELCWDAFETVDCNPELNTRPNASQVKLSGSNHHCDSETCTIVQTDKETFRCVGTGYMHTCEPCRDGFACASSVEGSDSWWTCRISARTFPNAPTGYSSLVLEPSRPPQEDDDDPDNAEWAGYQCCTLKRLRRF